MTGLTSNIDSVIERFNSIKGKISGASVNQALTAGVNAAMGQMKNRIFNQGKDAEGIAFGQYRGKKAKQTKAGLGKLFKKPSSQSFLIGGNIELSQYEIKRVKKGRQVRYKDLEFIGDLRRGIVLVQQSQISVVCAIPNDDIFVIAEGQEQQIGRLRGSGRVKIFSLSQDERDLMVININETLKQLYVGAFNS